MISRPNFSIGSAGKSALDDAIEQLDKIGFDIGNTHISLWTACQALLVLVAIMVLAQLGSKLARRIVARMTRLDPVQRVLGEKIVSILVWVTAGLIGIDVLGINLSALTVFSGAFGLAVGFGLQKTFGNLIAGMILLMDRSIKPGDVIAVKDTAGKESFGQIRKIGIRAVSLTTRDKVEYLIPNENLMVNQVENWSYSSRDVRVKIPVGLAYGTDIELAEKLMIEVAQSTARVLAEPAPAVWLTAFGESAIQFEIHVWIDDPEEGVGNVRSQVLKQLWHRFKDSGVLIPFPQRDIYIRQWPGAPGAAPDQPTAAGE